MITFSTKAELARAIASLESRAAAAERAGLPRTAQSWRDTIANLRERGSIRRPPLCEDCGKNRSDPPSKLCPGCEAYREHTGYLQANECHTER
jgi:hypothetical protein